jgi:hypothetical protein
MALPFQRALTSTLSQGRVTLTPEGFERFHSTNIRSSHQGKEYRDNGPAI